jgi:SAM-dependent methyltransferase
VLRRSANNAMRSPDFREATLGKLAYLVRSSTSQFQPDRRTCPNCGGRGQPVARKYAVTALERCDSCCLLFRTPTDPPDLGERFYNEEYVQGATTSLPSLDALERMKADDFAELENDYVGFARILKGLGAGEGSKVFDYGCSWGYGSYLFAKAGFEVKSFEISRPRRGYGQQHLNVDLVEDFDAFVAAAAGTFDVFFSSHVLEHVPSPSAVIERALRLLRPGGLLVSVCPNGTEAFRSAQPAGWRLLWGEVHPNLLDDVYLARTFRGMPYLIGSSPVTIGDDDLRHLQGGTGERRLDALERPELFFAARPPG